MRPDYYKVVGFPLTLILAVFAFFFMQIIFDLRTEDIRQSLKQSDDNSNQIRSLALVTRYQILKAHMQGQAEQKEDYLKEGKIEAILSASKQPALKARNSAINNVAFHFVNMVSSLTSTEKLVHSEYTEAQTYLQTAYLMERNRQFTQAAAIYDQALKFFPENSQEQIYSHLHRGFCRSFIERRTEALEDYQKVINLNPQSESAETAIILAALLRQVESSMNEADKMLTSEAKAVSYYKLMSYAKALIVFDKIKESDRTQSFYFYRGRAYEELGKSQLAVADFRKALEIDPLSDLGLNANRRLYMLGTYYGAGDDIRKQAAQIAEKTGDSSFVADSNRIERALEAQAPTTAPVDQAEEGKFISVVANKIQKIQALKEKERENIYLLTVDDGSIFIGNILKENKLQIEMKTALGTIQVPQNKLLKKELWQPE